MSRTSFSQRFEISVKFQTGLSSLWVSCTRAVTLLFTTAIVQGSEPGVPSHRLI